MSKIRVKFIIFMLAALGASVCLARNEFWRGPFFWQEKPEIQEKMKTERYVPVSVISTEGKKDKIWWMKGAGLVNAPMNFVFKKSRDFKEIKKLKEIFSKVEWNKSKTKLLVVPAFLDKKLIIKFRLWESRGRGLRRLHFKVVRGAFRGSEGAFIFKEITRQETEVGLIARHDGDVTSYGNGVFAIAVEGVLQHMANSLRSYVEDEWKKTSKEKVSVN